MKVKEKKGLFKRTISSEYINLDNKIDNDTLNNEEKKFIDLVNKKLYIGLW